MSFFNNILKSIDLRVDYDYFRLAYPFSRYSSRELKCRSSLFLECSSGLSENGPEEDTSYHPTTLDSLELSCVDYSIYVANYSVER
jgi:hypothetical protein